MEKSKLMYCIQWGRHSLKFSAPGDWSSKQVFFSETENTTSCAPFFTLNMSVCTRCFTNRNPWPVPVPQHYQSNVNSEEWREVRVNTVGKGWKWGNIGTWTVVKIIMWSACVTSVVAQIGCPTLPNCIPRKLSCPEWWCSSDEGSHLASCQCWCLLNVNLWPKSTWKYPWGQLLMATLDGWMDRWIDAFVLVLLSKSHVWTSVRT